MAASILQINSWDIVLVQSVAWTTDLLSGSVSEACSYQRHVGLWLQLVVAVSFPELTGLLQTRFGVAVAVALAWSGEQGAEHVAGCSFCEFAG